MIVCTGLRTGRSVSLQKQPSENSGTICRSVFGEMGLLDKAPRSVSAISLSDDTALKVIDGENFSRCFSDNPEEILFILQQMSMRLRQISRDYTGACRTVSDVMEADNAGIEKSPALKNHNAKTLA